MLNFTRANADAEVLVQTAERHRLARARFRPTTESSSFLHQRITIRFRKVEELNVAQIPWLLLLGNEDYLMRVVILHVTSLSVTLVFVYCWINFGNPWK